MMSRIDRTRRAVSAQKASRNEHARADEAPEPAIKNLPVAVGPVIAAPNPRADRRGAASELVAQLMGQDGERRGLRAGPPLFERARTAYNGIEWSGAFDRRARKGRTARTET